MAEMQNGGNNGDRSGAEIRLKGLAVSPGIAVARVCLFNESRHNVITPSLVDDGDVEHQVSRLMEAIAKAADRLDDLRGKVEREVGAAEAEMPPALGKHIEKLMEACGYHRRFSKTYITEGDRSPWPNPNPDTYFGRFATRNGYFRHQR